MKSKLLRNYGNNEQAKLQEKFASVKNQIDEKSDEIEQMTFSAKSGDGSVEVTVKGDNSLYDIKIDEKLLNIESREMLQDLILSTANKAMNEVATYTNNALSAITKDLPNLPDLGF